MEKALEPLADDAHVARDAGRTVTRVIAGETLIVPIAGGVADLEAIFTLNPVASRIWALLEQPTTPGRIAEAITAEFEVSFADARRDVDEFLHSLRNAGLLAATGQRG
jgi:hypothetical protein